MIDLRDILNGWKNVLITDDNIEELAAVRQQLCDQCPNKGQMLGVSICGLCHCPLTAKTRSKDTKCPDGRW